MATEMSEKMDACAAAGELKAEHGLMTPFEGTWKAHVKMWMDPSADAMEWTGKMTNRLVLGGRFLEQDYANDDGTFSGKGLMGFNTIENRWEGVWVDTMATFMMIDQGSYHAGSKTWTMHSEMRDPGSGHMMSKRSTLEVHADGSHTLAMYFTPSAGAHAGQESKCMEILYTKA